MYVVQSFHQEKKQKKKSFKTQAWHSCSFTFISEQLFIYLSFSTMLQQAEVPEDSDEDDDPDEVFGFITMLNLTERKVRWLAN